MNSESRLPGHPLGADAASEADGIGGEGRDLPAARGFLGRFFDALTGGDDDADADDRAPAQVAPGMVNLRRMRVEDVAVPKAEMVAAPETSSLDDLVGLFREHGFSRLPIYGETMDSPLGMIHLKDLALKHGFGQGGDFQLRPMLRPLLYVPPSMSIGVLLQQMQQKRIHMALVIDEYGGVDGLVTIEDLIEQVIGEIEDEHDEAEGSLWVVEKPGQWLIQARAPVNDVETETGLTLTGEDEDEDIDTLLLRVMFAGSQVDEMKRFVAEGRAGEGEGVKGGVLTSLVQQIYNSSDTTDFHLKTSDLEINLTKGEK